MVSIVPKQNSIIQAVDEPEEAFDDGMTIDDRFKRNDRPHLSEL
jgi:hypothetical protein